MRKTLALTCGVLVLAASVAYGQQQTTICKIQDGSIPLNTEVFVDSVVVTAIDMKPSTYGFWAQHPQPCADYPNREYSGILVYMSYALPDTIEGIGVEPGDLVSVRGNYTEYPSGGVPSVSEITYPDDAYAPAVHIIQEDYGMPPEAKLTVHNFGTIDADSANCERWEGVWCRVDTLVCTEWIEPLEYAEWAVVELEDFTGFPKTTDTLRVDDKLVIPSLAKPSVGDTLKTIYGVFTYEYGNYKIWPRDNDDVIYLSSPPAPNLLQVYSTRDTRTLAVFDREVSEASAANSDNFSFVLTAITTTQRLPLLPNHVQIDHDAPAQSGMQEELSACDIENTFGVVDTSCQTAALRIGVAPITLVQTSAHANTDSSQVAGEQVTVGGIVIGGSGDFGGFYLGTPGGGPYSGVYVFDSSNPRSVGDSVVVSAEVTEYYGMTEMYLPEYVSTPIFTLTPDIEPTVVEPSVLVTPAVSVPPDAAEPWEGMLVQVDSVAAASYPTEFGEWTVQEGTDTVHVDDTAGYTYTAVVGDSMNLAGILTYSYNIWEIEPRDDDDIDVFYLSSVDEENLGLHFVKLRNYPNPFNPKTVIEFGITSTTPVKLTIYDVSGRLVRTLMDEVREAGTYQVHWNGNDANGRPTAAGVYYCRLEAGERVEMQKLVMVK